jgi:hypothetical protein
MYPRQLEQLARQRPSELRATTHPGRPARRISSAASPAATRHEPRKPIRSHTGWALVALGLKIAESGSR